MSLHDLVILVPCHSLEDFPTELADGPAESLLNAFAVAWHPVLLADAGCLPHWHRADEPPVVNPGQCVLAPTAVSDWLPHGYVEQARQAGALVLTDAVSRTEWLAALKDVVPFPESLEDERAADCMALGFHWLQVELLTRHMRSFDSVDEIRFQNRAVGAAKAILASDFETADLHLRGAYEVLLEARERFFPAECYLLDLCLLHPETSGAPLMKVLSGESPSNLLVTSGDLQKLCAADADVQTALKHVVDQKRISVVGGESLETPVPLIPLVDWLHDLERGQTELAELTGQKPTVWGRRKYGLTNALPQFLRFAGYRGALHIVLDDGLYPDFEYTKFRWQGRDGTIIDGLSRIPLAADSSASFLRFPLRMSESMDHDQATGVIFARWPDLSRPWLEDLQRGAKYAPVLGRWVTLEEFFQLSDSSGRLANYQAGEYITPYLIQAVARREKDPISKLRRHGELSRRLQTGEWCDAVTQALWLKMAQPAERQVFIDVRHRLLAALCDSATPAWEELRQEVDQLTQRAGEQLAKLIVGNAPAGAGVLVFNLCSFPRRKALWLDGLHSLPPVQGAIVAVQRDAGNPERVAVLVDLPPCGFVWIPRDGQGAPSTPPRVPMADNEGVLRNQKFEVVLSDATGGIAQIRYHNRRGNFLSQQLTYRFPRERTIPTAGSEESLKSAYAEMRATGRKVISTGPVYGEIETTGLIIDQTNQSQLAGYRQRTRVWNTLPIVDVEIELDDVKLVDGDPWNHYFAARFAWNDSSAAVTRSVWHGAQGFAGERFDSQDYIEIASESERVTIVPHGLAFHRKTGLRMVDSLLATGQETARSFRFTLVIDDAYPLNAAWQAMMPPLVVPVEQGPPRSGQAGWFFNLDAKNVQILSVEGPHSLEQSSPSGQSPLGLKVRLLETEGMARQTRLTLFRQPLSARKTDLRNRTILDLPIEGDAVVVDLSPFELADVELRLT